MRPAGVLFALLLLSVGCPKAPVQRSSPSKRAPSAGDAQAYAVDQVIFEAGLQNHWEDYGWAAREVKAGAPALLNLSNYGGWTLARPGLTGRFGGVVFRFKAPDDYGDFLEIRVDSATQTVFPRIRVGPDNEVMVGDGWKEVVVPMSALDPEGLPFDRVVLRAFRAVGAEWITVDHVCLTRGDGGTVAPASQAWPVSDAVVVIDGAGAAKKISPLVYGIAYAVSSDARDPFVWSMRPTARRWGGNPTSRYNWELGNAWNTANDWFYENVNYTGDPTYSYRRFLAADVEHHVATALTVPMLGWVAKDTSSFSFPVSAFGAQAQTDPGRPEAGNGVSKEGRPISPGTATRTSLPVDAAWVGRWVQTIRREDTLANRQSVHSYILDNEPMLWNSTHRDVHPEPVGYDELLERTVAYAGAVRAADPAAVIAGPALWGWPAYFFSAKDSAISVRLKPDRLLHGDVPLLAWYLRKLREYEKNTGTRLLDVVDVHFYPQAKGVGVGKDGGVDANTAALRLRSTRALWDPRYKDESWIDDTIQLIPRLKAWIAENYPGRGISIGEYNFGAEEHMSGGLAVAEALGRFGQQGVTSAFYWTYPPEHSPAYWAFRAFRDFDGKGGGFLDNTLATTAADPVSVFASRDEAGGHLVVVALNLARDRAVRASIGITGAAGIARTRSFSYAGGPDGFVAQPAEGASSPPLVRTLPPYSISVFDVDLAAPLPGSVER